ncbi:MAG: hypothetical protein L0H84_11785 [Pseudonocardia sp.]|nr:hypothetical protein [Pseudonocardia sp.]
MSSPADDRGRHRRPTDDDLGTDPPTVVIRHVVMPPLERDPRHEPAHGSWTDLRSSRWGFVLGGAVVTVCTVYIAVVGLGAQSREPASLASSALTGRPALTFSVSAVPPAAAAARVSDVVPTPARATAPKSSGAVTPTGAAEAASAVLATIAEAIEQFDRDEVPGVVVTLPPIGQLAPP